jgi:dCMP deaminase
MLIINNTSGNKHITWNEYFMGICELSALRSKDPVTKVGACIVNVKNHIIGIGYNGFPNNCSDSELPWEKNNPEWLNNKYPYVVHAEVNAIMNVNNKITDNSILYTSLFPCNECAKLIIQSGIKKIIYKNDKNINKNSCIASKKMFDLANISYYKFSDII